MNRIKFELGKYYQHTTGSKLYICGIGETHFYGSSLIAENEYGELAPVGKNEENAVNYHEITKNEFIMDSDNTKGKPITSAEVDKFANCYNCAFKNDTRPYCDKHRVRIFPNLNTPNYDINKSYYPCVECSGRNFKERVKI
jgi:hypothetical protein